MKVSVGSNLYTGLAQAFATPDITGLPAWLAVSGKEWPIYEPAVQLAEERSSKLWNQTVDALEKTPATSLSKHEHTYETLFFGKSSSPIWLYECMYTNGRMPGPATFAVEALYKKAGLEINYSELADHAALELTFLAFLTEQEASNTQNSNTWAAAKRLFIKNHAVRWLPNLGRQLSRTEYPAWAALGFLLAAIFEVKRPKPKTARVQSNYPIISQASECNLCGFCIQVCPTQALGIEEDDSTTALWLEPELCIHCNKCERICEQGALSMQDSENNQDPVALIESPRAKCSCCGKPTVSELELNWVAMRLGERPGWLEKCRECR
ncbi:MAG: hypothetical protein FVQ83_11755 [Chloroflexi bacterium]|nr:hypothetical protein [Chloroflexota bacterium]